MGAYLWTLIDKMDAELDEVTETILSDDPDAFSQFTIGWMAEDDEDNSSSN